MTDWTTACPDWEDRIRAGESLLPLGPIFPAQAERAMEVFRSIRVVDVANPTGEVDEDGRPVPPTLEQVCGSYGIDLAAVIFGAYDAETGKQLIREVFLKIPKKNWKSGLAAAIMLTLMVLNWRPSNEAAVIAPTKETADNVFKPMADSIKADPELAKIFHIQPLLRTIKHRVTGMTCRVYAADTDTISGKKWAFVILEEVWLLAQRNGSSDMVVEATGGQASRLEGIVISITTESDDEPVGFYKEKLEYARKVRDGVIDAPHFLPVLYEWPAEMLKSKAYLDPKNFPLVNPNYGASVDPVDLEQKFEQAVEAGGKSLQLFLAKRLNVPPSETIAGSWAGVEYWLQQGEVGLTLEQVIDRSEVLTAGIDGGGLDDLLGLAVLGREKVTGKWLHWGRAWCHPIALQRRQSEAERFKKFAADGDLVIVARVGDDVEQVAEVIQKCEASGKLDKIGVDAAGITSIVDALVTEEFKIDRIVGVSQGWRMNGAIKTVERMLAGGQMVHGGSPLMAWAVGNAKVEPRGNAVMITKEVAGTGKIDPLMALFDAVTLMALDPQPRGKQYQIFALGK